MAERWLDRLSAGLSKSRQKLAGSLNQLVGRGADLDDDFWDGLEEALLGADVGLEVAADAVGELKLQARAEALPDAPAVVERLATILAAEFVSGGEALLTPPVTLVFVGINGTGKTTTVGKLAARFAAQGRRVVLGNADTFRAAAAEQLGIWSQRAGVEYVSAPRGADPASVAFSTIERAESSGADVAIVDTAGRLHTSTDLMRELEKVVRVVRERSPFPVVTILVVDATTGQNGLVQAREFDRALNLGGLVLTKLDGTAKGGIAVAVSRALGVPVLLAGVGEGVDDLLDFDPEAYAASLVGADVR